MNNKLIAILTLALGKFFGHGWAVGFEGAVNPWESLGEAPQEVAEAVTNLRDEYDAGEPYASTAYATIMTPWDNFKPALVHRTGSDSLIFIWGKGGQLVLHLSPTTHRLRWVAGGNLSESFAISARDFYEGKGPKWARELISFLVGELELPGHIDPEKAAAAAELLGARPEDVFGEALLPSYVTGFRKFALEWAMARNEWDAFSLISQAGLDLDPEELPRDGERSDHWALIAPLSSEAVSNFAHHFGAFYEAAIAAATNREEWDRLLAGLPDELREFLDGGGDKEE